MLVRAAEDLIDSYARSVWVGNAPDHERRDARSVAFDQLRKGRSIDLPRPHGLRFAPHVYSYSYEGAPIPSRDRFGRPIPEVRAPAAIVAASAREKFANEAGRGCTERGTQHPKLGDPQVPCPVLDLPNP